MVDRVSTFAQTQRLVESNLRLQGQYGEGQVQIASGQKSETYDGIARDTQRILSIESDMQRINMQLVTSEKAFSRNDMVYDILGGITQVAQNFMADLSTAISNIGGPTAGQMQSLAQNSLDSAVAGLNTQLAGRYLFAGSATQTAPVDPTVATWGGAVIPSVADTDYYQGNAFIQSVEVTDSQTVNYGFLASDSSLELIMRAYDLIITTPGDVPTYQEAFDLINQGLEALATRRASVANNSASIQQAMNQNREDLNLLQNLIADLKEVDLAEVSVNIQQIEAQLEASFAVTTNLLNLSIVNFIR